MVRRTHPTPTEDAPDPHDPVTSDDARPQPATGPDLAAFPVVGLTRRRMAMLLGAVLAMWVVIVFARQVGEASAASNRADSMVAANAARQDEVAALENELQEIGQTRYILQQARGYGLGGPKEVAFELDPGAPPLPADAPGSAALRVGAPTPVSPLDRWLTLLFGPSD
jgi:hypothetical protein